MILYRKYGKVIEITRTQKTPIPRVGGISSTREIGAPIKIRRIDNARRTKSICMRKLLSAIEELGAPLFITLTFQGSASDILFASKASNRFFRRLQDGFKDSQCLLVPELSPRGRIHFHGLLFGVSQEWGDVKKGKRTISIGRERKERKFAKLWGYGFVDLLRTDGSPRVASYVSKYVIKSANEPFLSPIRLVRNTKGFPQPLEFRFKDNENFDFLFSKKLPVPRWEKEFHTPFMGMITKSFYDII